MHGLLRSQNSKVPDLSNPEKATKQGLLAMSPQGRPLWAFAPVSACGVAFQRRVRAMRVRTSFV